MYKAILPLLISVLLMGRTATAQAPAAEVQALTHRLNELQRTSHPDEHSEAVVSLANCGVKQTFRKYRASNHPSSTNVNISTSKNGSGWGIKSDDKVELELTLSLDWAEVGSIAYAPKKDEKTHQHYYQITIKRPDTAKGKGASGIASSLTLDLHTQDEKEVAALTRRLEAVSRGCQGKKS